LSFLKATMEKMGFNEKWIKWIMSLNIANATVMMKRARGKNFNLQRLIRHGCPLAPYLFPLVANVLAYMLMDPKYELKELSVLDKS
jgi:hypothetical protein